MHTGYVSVRVVFSIRHDKISLNTALSREVASMKILIAGGGKVGSELTAKLSAEGHEITLIDSSADVLESVMENFDIIAVQGNAASMEVLEEAGVRDADLLIAATDADEVNLLSCLTGHGMNPDLHTIGRIRNHEYRHQAYEMREVFGLNMAINPEREAAVEISRLLKYPGFLNIETFANGIVEIVSLKIDSSSPLNNISLKKLNSIIHCQVLVCAVQREGQCLIPNGNFVLKANDIIYVTASTNNLSTLLKNLGIITRKVKHVLIAGGGRISYYLARELEATGLNVSIIEQDADRCEELASLLPNATIVIGDASSQEFLDREGVEKYDAMVNLTGLDELNIVMALYARARNVPQVVTKLSHAEHNKILETLPIGSVVSPKELSCNTIVRYVRAMQNSAGAARSVHMIANGQGEAIEFMVTENDLHIGEPLRTLKIRKDVLIASISHGIRTEIASGNSSYDVGDIIVLVSNGKDAIRNLNDIFTD